ncbi:MAG: MBL fold metallo-hydrolase [Deltaproteobacteria bacterium]|nr:MBL fold metallo-hydrolase [Deltaproteobacteria bacterium]
MRFSLYSVEGNRQWLDGGSMFGNAPKALWSRWVRSDELNRIELACRGFLLIDHERDRRILFETGIGFFFEPKLRDRYGVSGDGHVLLESLRARGVTPEQVDAVVLSHLHFDHAGGLLSPWCEGRAPELVFPRAQFIVGEQAWQRACEPHLRDRVSFLSELRTLLEASGRLVIVSPGDPHPLGQGFSYVLSEGHTPGQLLTVIQTSWGPAFFCGDLVPGTPWIRQAITMGYDRYPERLIDEKHLFLQRCFDEQGILLFTHDAKNAGATLSRDERQRLVFGKGFEEINWLVGGKVDRTHP